MKGSIAANTSTLVALLEDGPKTKYWLQRRLGLSSYRFGQALAQARLRGYVEIHANRVQASAHALEILAEGRKALESDGIVR